MKEGTLITCGDAEDLKQMLKELGEAGYGAIVRDYHNHIIVITSVPERKG